MSGRHALPRQRTVGALLPELRTQDAGSEPRPKGGSRRAPRSRPDLTRLVSGTLEGPAPWARTVAFSGATGVTALTVGFTVLGDSDGVPLDVAPQPTAAVTVLEPQERAPLVPRQRGAGSSRTYDDGAAARESRTTTPERRAQSAAASTRPGAPAGSTHADATASAAPSTAPSEAPAEPAPDAAGPSGLVPGLTGTVGDTVAGALRGVTGILPGG